MKPIAAFAAAWGLQLAFATLMPLMADEAYYAAWAAHPALGYFDHPPAVAWWMALSFGHPRLPTLILMPIAFWFLADAGRRMGVERWPWIPALVAWTPLGLGVVITTPDAPLIFAWCFVLWGISAKRVLVVGGALGLALWAKPMALIGVPCVLWVMGRRRGPWAVGIALALYSPHVVWSLTHGGLPWAFQSGRQFGHFGLPEAIGGQLLLLSPGLCLLAVRAWRAPSTARILSLPILGFWLALSLVTRLEANWTALAWPAATWLLVDQPRRWRRPAVLVAVGFTVALVSAALLAEHLLPVGKGPPRAGLRACLEEATELPLAARRYQDKALLDARGVPVAWRPEGRRSQYDLWEIPESDPCDLATLEHRHSHPSACPGRLVEVSACGRRLTECRCR